MGASPNPRFFSQHPEYFERRQDRRGSHGKQIRQEETLFACGDHAVALEAPPASASGIVTPRTALGEKPPYCK
jgi:hypothetical protein